AGREPGLVLAVAGLQLQGLGPEVGRRELAEKAELRCRALRPNAFDTNAISHPRTYTLAYVVARSNGLGVLESFLWTLAASVAWEYLAEFREDPSINDLIMSPISAVATGETLVQLSEFFARGSDNLFNNIAAAVLSPPQAV